MTGAITPQQADREAAADLLATLAGDHLPAWEAVRAIKAGEADDHRFVTVFAHHAQQARLEERERCARIAAGYVPEGACTDYCEDNAETIANIANAIRKGEAA